uniref:Uncharacterized protein n=1 Tax=Anguilla anguilla TaxID=7936 RepID=A0A0E9S2Z0_ANGAN
MLQGHLEVYCDQYFNFSIIIHHVQFKRTGTVTQFYIVNVVLHSRPFEIIP